VPSPYFRWSKAVLEEIDMEGAPARECFSAQHFRTGACECSGVLLKQHAFNQQRRLVATQTNHSGPNPGRIFETLNAYQRTMALKAAIELDIFSTIAEGAVSVPAIAANCKSTQRGIRILCDYLVIIGFLTKQIDTYALAPESAVFLDRRSPAYLGSMSRFLTLPEILDTQKNLADIVRNGHPTQHGGDVLETENPMWVEFARSMAGIQRPYAEAIAGILDAKSAEKWKILDIAAGHGIFGITIAKANPNAVIFALDWPSVLTVAEDNAAAAGLSSRFHKISGSAFQQEFGSDYDVILLTGFLHHFDPQGIGKLLRKVLAALAPNGRVVTLEFIPNEDRVSPPESASFSMTMLGATPAGDAYPFSQLDRMFKDAGFSSNELRRLPGPESIVVSRK
jgi:2-polyprenyl-3-methyl-5-hydroxy-6-metoxy-1,4-benzoquinol methylase